MAKAMEKTNKGAADTGPVRNGSKKRGAMQGNKTKGGKIFGNWQKKGGK